MRLIPVAVFVVALLVPQSAGAEIRPIDEGGDSAPCVTYEEFEAWQAGMVPTGMPESRVKRIFDTNGTRRGPVPIELGDADYRSYQPCDSDGYVVIWFDPRTPRRLATGGIWSD